MNTDHTLPSSIPALALRIAPMLLGLSLCSCITPPPPRTYRPEVARHLDRLAHGKPLTPLPDPGATVWECY